jgi:RHS repeat-associated protein
MLQNYIKYNAKTASKSTPSFTGKERDSETGFSYFGARYYDSDLMTGWLSVDPMADKYPSLSPYAYCGWTRPTGADEHRLIEFNIANNPIRLVDPNGEDIINAYEKYKNNHQEIQDLKNKKEQAKTRQERREIQWQINNAESNYDKYLKVEKMLDDFKNTEPEDYKKLDNLIYNGAELDIKIYISDDKKSSEGGYGKIESYFTLDKENKQINISPIKITIYRDAFLGSNNTGKLTLANEFGDVIFMTTRPEKSYVEQRLNYYQRASTQFSFDYEHYIDNPLENKKPNPYDY